MKIQEKLMWLMVLLGLPVFLLQGYVFYIAPCNQVKLFWALVHVPGRCIL